MQRLIQQQNVRDLSSLDFTEYKKEYEQMSNKNR